MKNNYFTKWITGFILAIVFSVCYALPSPKDVEAAVAANDLPRAERLVREVIAAQPNKPRAHYNLAQILFMQHQYPQALAEMDTAKSLDSTLSFAKSPGVFEDKYSEMQSKIHVEKAIEKASPLPVVQKPVDHPIPEWYYYTFGAVIGIILLWVIIASSNKKREAEKRAEYEARREEEEEERRRTRESSSGSSIGLFMSKPQSTERRTEVSPAFSAPYTPEPVPSEVYNPHRVVQSQVSTEPARTTINPAVAAVGGVAVGAGAMYLADRLRRDNEENEVRRRRERLDEERRRLDDSNSISSLSHSYISSTPSRDDSPSRSFDTGSNYSFDSGSSSSFDSGSSSGGSDW
ncbi:tetratricopeptide repeat protein [Ralstonia phage RP13]|nr:tetratricopeptide repeat protein [Ralstonia phage RP13]